MATSELPADLPMLIDGTSTLRPGGGFLAEGSSGIANFLVFPPTTGREIVVVLVGGDRTSARFDSAPGTECELEDGNSHRWVACETIMVLELRTEIALDPKAVTGIDGSVWDGAQGGHDLGFYLFGLEPEQPLRVKVGFQRPTAASVTIEIRNVFVGARTEVVSPPDLTKIAIR